MGLPLYRSPQATLEAHADEQARKTRAEITKTSVSVAGALAGGLLYQLSVLKSTGEPAKASTILASLFIGYHATRLLMTIPTLVKSAVDYFVETAGKDSEEQTRRTE